MIRRGTVPVKLMLAGEYAILLPNSSALRLALEDGFEWEFEECSGGLRVELPDINVFGEFDVSVHDRATSGLPTGVRLVLSVARRLGVFGGRFRFARKTSLPSSGSAALVVAAARALATESLDGNVLFRLASTIHAEIQGMGSGADVAACVFGGIVRVTRGAGLLPWEVGGDSWPSVENRPFSRNHRWFVCGDTGERSHTGDMLNRLRATAGSLDPLEAHRVQSNALVSALWEEDSGDCAGVAEEANQSLRELNRRVLPGIFTKSMDEMLRSAGLPCRPSGAGGGDCVIGWSSDFALAQRSLRRWEELGYQGWLFNPAGSYHERT